MHEAVQDYYGKVLAESDDLKTNACKTDAAMPGYLKQALAAIHDEVLSRYYGCGLVFPEKIEGMTIVDLGCGTGRDVYLLSQLVGPTGRVIGVDMTKEQLEVAERHLEYHAEKLQGMTILDLGCGTGRDVYLLSQLVGPSGRVIGVDMTSEQLEIAERHLEYHAEKFGYEASNVEFHHGYIEQLDQLGLEPGSVDIVVSNCVLNLAPDKLAVLRGVERLLKPGGELYFADVYADRRISADLMEDPVLYGECLSGALYWNDFLNMAKQAGFADPRLVTDRRLTIENPSIEERIGHIGFFSATYRLFKLADLESHCEEYGQAVIYRGGIAHHEEVFQLDSHHRIERGRVFPVCGNTWRMLHDTRFREHFEFIGDFSTHFSIFADCGTPTPFSSAGTPASGDASEGGCC